MSQEEVKVFEPDLRIKGVDIENFRGFEKLELEFHPQLTVLIGENGAGKTAILDCLMIGIFLFLEKQFFLEEMTSMASTEEFFPREEDRMVAKLINENVRKKFFLSIKQGTSETKNRVDFLFDNNLFGFSSQHNHKAIKTWHSSEVLSQQELDSLLSQLHREPSNFPTILYYPTHEAPVGFIEFKEAQTNSFGTNNSEKHLVKELLESPDFINFFNWYKWQENIEKQIGENNILNAVRKAIYHLLSDENNQFDQLAINWLNNPNGEMLIQKNKTPLIINQLSSGEKTLLALVADLARRLALNNPHREKPLEGYGVVLIDEIDLHLHPRWQREVIPKLRETFPNCQWIVTTHSPQVLSRVDPENVFILKDFQVFNNTQATYGRDANSILSDIMGVSPRPAFMQQEIKKCFNLIDDGELEAAEKLLTKLSEQVGPNDPDIVYGYSLVNFMSEE